MLFNKTVMKSKTVSKTGLSNQDLIPDNALNPVILDQHQVINNRYEILEEIGRGTFSTVYKAHDLKMDCFKALKIFGSYEDVKDFYAYLRNEATLLIKLNHPNILRIYDFVDSNYIFLDTELIEGSNLREMLSRQKINKKEALNYSIQLASALKHAHDQMIAHLDIKPENILIDKNRNLKLTDFGISKIKSKKNDNWSGTLSYMPPEKMKNEDSDIQSDIFAYGITIYEMFYQNYPFLLDDNGIPDYEMPVQLKNSKKKIDQIIRKCLFYFPEDRYQNFTEILSDLEKKDIIPESPVIKLAAKIYRNFPRPKINKSNKKELIGITIALFALLMLLPFYVLTQKNINEPVKEILIDSPPYSVLINLAPKGKTPLKTKLTDGDQIQLLDRNNVPVLDYTYNNEKKLKIRFDRNYIFINNHIKGQLVSSRKDLPLKNNLSYIKSDILLFDKDLRLQRNPRLNLHFTNAIENQFDFLPINTRFLNLRNNKNIRKLQKLTHLQNLTGLDVSEIDSLNFETLPKLHKLTLLNTKKTHLKNLFKLTGNPQLKYLNIDRNNIEDFNAIKALNNLEILSSIQDSVISYASPFCDLPNLTSLSTNMPFTQPSEIEKIKQTISDNNESMLRRKRIIEKEKNWWNPIIFYLVTLLLSFIIFFLGSLIFKKYYKSEKKEINNTQTQKEIEYEKASEEDINKISAAIRDNRLYLPAEENALTYIKNLEKKNIRDEKLDEKKKEVIQMIENKIETHKKRNEFEPVFIASAKSCEIFPSRFFSKSLQMSRDKLKIHSSLKMIRIKGGKYLMGDFTSEESANGFQPHIVEISDFFISQTVITNDQFCEFLNYNGNKTEDGTPWYKDKSIYARIELHKHRWRVIPPYGSFPVYEVSWWGAQRYCEWKGGRLPTEAEWEFVCRNRGKKMIYSTGNDINKEQANFLVDANDNLWHSVFPVKSFKPNKLNVYEMCGNVLEWCFDWYDKNYYKKSETQNPKGALNGDLKVVRGGGWCFPKENMRSYFRGGVKPSVKTNYLGFRLVKENRSK